MIETISVSLSGLQLALLMQQNFKAKYGQEGFLLGDIIEKKTRKVTDSDVQQDYISRTIKVVSCVPCPKNGYFYDGIGRLKEDVIKRLLGGSRNRVVAWFKSQPTSGIQFTFREKIVHRQLSNFFEINPEHFTCCILSNESSDNAAVCTFSQNFLRLRDNDYEELSMHIANLGDKTIGYRAPEQQSETFKRITRGIKLDKKSLNGLAIITNIQNGLHRHSSKVAKDLAEAEKRLFELEQEVKLLQEGQVTNRESNSEIDHPNEVLKVKRNNSGTGTKGATRKTNEKKM